MEALTLLLWSLHAALGSVGLTVIVRNAPVVRGWVQAMKKPWACNICMPLYTVAATLGVPIAWTGDWRHAAAYPAAYALAYVALEKMARPPAGPPPIPAMLLDIEEDGDTD